MDKQKQKQKRKQIFTIAFPIMISSIVMQVQVLTDSMFLGRVDTDFFAAVGNAFFPFFLFQVFLLTIPTGTAVLIAQRIGANKAEDGKRFAESSYKFNTLLAVVMFFVWFFFAKQIFIFMGVEDPILTYSVTYMRFLAFTLLALGVHSTSQGILYGIGMTKPLMYIGILRSLLNILLDWIFIFGKFGVPAMGIQGAALGTVLSDFVGMPILFTIILLSKKQPFKIEIFSIIKSKWKDYKEVIRIGLPSGLEDVIWSLGNLTIVLFLNKLGQVETGIYNLIMRIELTPFFLYIGFAKAAQTLVGNRIGEQDHKGAIKDGLACLKYTLYTGAIFLVLFLTIPDRILGLFTKDAGYIKTVVPFLMLAAAYLIPKAMNITIGHSIRGYGDTKWMLYTQIFGTVFQISLSYIFIFTLNFGIFGFFYVLIIDETFRAMVNTVRFLKGVNWSLGTFLKPRRA